METPVGTAAILEKESGDINSLIVILKPPIREVKHRYQNADEKLETLIKDIKDLVDERNVYYGKRITIRKTLDSFIRKKGYL
jgi:archaellum component FlaC